MQSIEPTRNPTEHRESAAGEFPASALDGMLTSVLLYDLGAVLRRRLDAALDDADTGLRTRHVAVLTVLACEAPMTQRATAEAADIDPATMVKTVDDLERLGLVRRDRNPRDRRAHDLTLTDAGRAMATRAELLLAGIEQSLFAPLGDAGHAQLRVWLIDLLRRSGADCG